MILILYQLLIRLSWWNSLVVGPSLSEHEQSYWVTWLISSGTYRPFVLRGAKCSHYPGVSFCIWIFYNEHICYWNVLFTFIIMMLGNSVNVLFHLKARFCWLSFLLAEHESPWEWVSGLGAAWPGLVARHYYHSCQMPSRLCTSHSQDTHRHCQVFSWKWVVSIDNRIMVGLLL